MSIFLIIYAFIAKETIATSAYTISGEVIIDEITLMKKTKPASLPRL